MLTLDCYGTFRLCSKAGDDLTPASEKAKGLIALLAFSRNHEQRRRWLQDKLWSEKDPALSAQSLRQALSEIRKALGDHAPCLVADRRRVALVGLSVQAAPSDAKPTDLFSTLQIDDPEFHDWLLIESGSLAAGAATAAPADRAPQHITRVTRTHRAASDPAAEYVRRTLEDSILLSLQEIVPLEIVDEAGSAGPARNSDLELDVESLQSGNTFALRVVWNRPQSRQRLWSNSRSFEAETGPVFSTVAFQKLSHDAVQALRSHTVFQTNKAHPHLAADYLCQKAVARIFRLSIAGLIEADRMLEQAHDISPRGLYMAWRGFLRMIQVIERHPTGDEQTADEAAAYVRRAMEIEPQNSYVCALAASVLSTLQDAGQTGAQIAQEAVAINPANPLAWDALSTAAIYNGAPEKAHLYATRAQRIGGVGSAKAWLDMACCLTSVVMHNYSLAKEYARSAHILCPEFRPPLRYLVALSAADDERVEGQHFLQKIRKQETDFSFERLATDRDYPIAALRKSGLSLDPRYF